MNRADGLALIIPLYLYYPFCLKRAGLLSQDWEYPIQNLNASKQKCIERQGRTTSLTWSLTKIRNKIIMAVSDLRQQDQKKYYRHFFSQVLRSLALSGLMTRSRKQPLLYSNCIPLSPQLCFPPVSRGEGPSFWLLLLLGSHSLSLSRQGWAH